MNILEAIHRQQDESLRDIEAMGGKQNRRKNKEGFVVFTQSSQVVKLAVRHWKR